MKIVFYKYFFNDYMHFTKFFMQYVNFVIQYVKLIIILNNAIKLYSFCKK